MGTLFEDVCRQYVSRYWDEKPVQVGAHWKSGLEIDVLTENIDGSHWFGECKWWNRPVGENVLAHLIENAKKLGHPWNQHPRYMLFSASGFTDTLKQRASAEGVLLLALPELFV